MISYNLLILLKLSLVKPVKKPSNPFKLAANVCICESTNKTFRKYSPIELIYEALFLNRKLNTSLKCKNVKPRCRSVSILFQG